MALFGERKHLGVRLVVAEHVPAPVDDLELDLEHTVGEGSRGDPIVVKFDLGKCFARRAVQWDSRKRGADEEC